MAEPALDTPAEACSSRLRAASICCLSWVCNDWFCFVTAIVSVRMDSSSD
jgi:hypothetical protein